MAGAEIVRDVQTHNQNFTLPHSPELMKLSLCLTKYHAMKTHPVLNKASRYEDVRVSGGTAPRIRS